MNREPAEDAERDPTDGLNVRHLEAQRAHFEEAYSGPERSHVGSNDPLVRYVTEWRLRKALSLLLESCPTLSFESSILFLCAGEGLEGSVAADMGFKAVTVSDLSESAMAAAARRDPRLRTTGLNAEETGLPNGAFEIVAIQDGLHHLQSPVRGLTEMLRVASAAVVFLEPHDSAVGRRFGTRWEVNGSATNFVFRWNRRTVEQVAASFLGNDRFSNLSFAFWHHNPAMVRLGSRLSSRFSVRALKIGKSLVDLIAGRFGNQFCGMVVKDVAVQTS